MGKKPKLFAHQKRILAETRDLAVHAAFWEQGTGKTRYLLENAEWLRKQGKVDAIYIISTNGMHRSWIEDEIPLWLADTPWTGYFYTAGKAKTLKYKRYLDRALNADYPIMAINYEAIMTKAAHLWMKKFFKRKRVFYILDESTAIKSPGIKRTFRIVSSGRWCDYRRIATGTPNTNKGPFDVYKPIQFLDYTFWKRHGFQTYAEFKAYFAVWKKCTFTNSKGKPYTTDIVDTYRNLDELKSIVATISSRVLKLEAFDLPPKLYSKRYFELTPEQARVYREIRDASMTFLSSGDLITVPLAMVRLLRLHQVTSNYLPTDTEPTTLIDKKKNPRLDCLAEVMEEVSHQAIIWARFHMDVALIMDLLGKRAVRCDGLVSKSDERAHALQAFKKGDKQFLVSNPATKGVSRGRNLQMAQTAVYYNNSFSLEDRLQSEDRPHRFGTLNPVNYIDIAAPDTVDIKIINSLRNNQNIASEITGDDLKEWL